MKNPENNSTTTKREEEEDDEPVSPTGRLMHTPKFNLAIILAMGYSTKIDPNLYKQCMQQTLLKHPRVSSILITSNGKSRWKRTRVDIEKHVFVPDVDPNMGSPDEFVSDFATNLSEIPMDMTKPLWELYILNVKTSDANSVVVMKIHHSLGDGVSLIALTRACARKLDDPDALPVLPSSKKPKKGGDRGLVMRLFVLIWTVMLITYYTLTDIATFIATLWFLRDTQTPIKADRGGAWQSRKRFVHRIVSLGDVKLIKTAMNASVNDVVLGVTEAGLSRYLNTIYEKNKENGIKIVKNRSNSLPRNLGVRTTVVFNLRPSPTIEDLAEMMEKEELNGMWGNVIGIVLLPFTIDLQEDPLTYIRRAKSTMDRKKLSLAPRCASDVMKLMMLLFGTKAAAFVTTAVFRNTTLTFSNVMGPKEEVNLFGHHLSYIAPSVSGFPQSLIVHYQSYADKLVISIGADEKLIPNPHQLCDDLIKSLQIIKEAVIRRGYPTESTMKNPENKSTTRREEEEEEKDDEPVSPTGRLMHTPKFNLAIILVMGYNTKIDPNLYKQCMQQTLVKHPRFSSILTTSNGKSCWKRTAGVDIEKHVFVPDVDPDMGSPDEFVADFATNLSEIPMDTTKPLWEFYILNVKTSDANSVVVMKIHHSLGDGVSLVALTHACSRKLDDPDALPVFPSSKKSEKRGSRGGGDEIVCLDLDSDVDRILHIDRCRDVHPTLWFLRDTRTPIKARWRRRVAFTEEICAQDC